MKSIIIVLIIGFLLTKAYENYEKKQLSLTNNLPNVIQEISDNTFDSAPLSVSYKCDGRIHCSQMTSCNEAEFFLQNCPNVAMDGNNDGEPCEKQWCN